MSFNERRRVDRTRTRAGVPDYGLLETFLTPANMFRDRPLGIKEQLKESKFHNEKQLENFQKIHQGVRERVALMASKQSRREIDAASIVAAGKDSNDQDHRHDDPQVPPSTPLHDIVTQSSGYGSQESPNSSPDSKGLRRLKF